MLTVLIVSYTHQDGPRSFPLLGRTEKKSVLNLFEGLRSDDDGAWAEVFPERDMRAMHRQRFADGTLGFSVYEVGDQDVARLKTTNAKEPPLEYSALAFTMRRLRRLIGTGNAASLV